MPDVVLLDRHLPDGHGEGFIDAIRTAGASRPKVIVLSADASELSREHCLAAGADEYLTKPPHAKELCERIRSLAAGH